MFLYEISIISTSSVQPNRVREYWNNYRVCTSICTQRFKKEMRTATDTRVPLDIVSELNEDENKMQLNENGSI